MKEWARAILCDADRMWSNSRKQYNEQLASGVQGVGEKLTPVSLDARNALGTFLFAAKIDARHADLDIDGDGGYELTIIIGERHYMFVIHNSGSISWQMFKGDFEVAGGGFNDVTETNIALSFTEWPEGK